MDLNPLIVEITPENLADHPGTVCFINKKHPCHHLKTDWLKDRFAEGLKIKLLYLEGVKQPVGFIEYVPGENCWRGVSAEGWMVIHCLWTNGKKRQRQGLGGLLIEEAEKDARSMKGVAVVTSRKAFMADPSIFIKHGYTEAETSGTEQLLVKPFTPGPAPVFNDPAPELDKYSKPAFIYSRQCPWVARFIEEVKPVLEEEGIDAEFIELKNPQEAQHAPSVYSGLSLVYKGRVLADRYISVTRFRNILKAKL